MTVTAHKAKRKIEPRKLNVRTQAQRLRILEDELSEMQGVLYAVMQALHSVHRKLE